MGRSSFKQLWKSIRGRIKKAEKDRDGETITGVRGGGGGGGGGGGDDGGMGMGMGMGSPSSYSPRSSPRKSAPCPKPDHLELPPAREISPQQHVTSPSSTIQEELSQDSREPDSAHAGDLPDNFVGLRPPEKMSQYYGSECGRAGTDDECSMRNTVEVDHTSTDLTPVTHERVNRLTTTVREEHVYRDVHEYDVFHSTQPVLDVEVLPARHFVQRPSGTKVEVPEENLAVYAGINSMWSVSARSSYSMSAAPRSASGYFQNADAIPRKIAMAQEPEEVDMSSTGSTPIESVAVSGTRVFL